MFCKKCGGLLVPSDSKLVCMSCYSESSDELSFDQKPHSKKPTITGTGDKQLESLPTTKAECTKCGNKEAHFWFVQTRASDEPPTKFFRCTKCSYTWRDYQ